MRARVVAHATAPVCLLDVEANTQVKLPDEPSGQGALDGSEESPANR